MLVCFGNEMLCPLEGIFLETAEKLTKLCQKKRGTESVRKLLIACENKSEYAREHACIDPGGKPRKQTNGQGIGNKAFFASFFLFIHQRVSSFPDVNLEKNRLRNKNIHIKYTIEPRRKTIAIITKF